MTLSQLFPLLPLIILAGSAIVVLLQIAFYRHHQTVFGLTVAGLLLAFVSLPVVAPALPQQVTALFIVDRYALFYLGLILAASLVVTLLSFSYLQKRPNDNPEELYLLLLVATFGSGVLVISRHFVSFFLGLEILTVSLYTLIAYQRTLFRRIEAGLKYLVLAAVSSSFLLFGMALVYANLGTMQLDQLASMLTTGGVGAPNLLLVSGLALMTIGIGFKLALVPFHMWTPDVYEGAAAPVTAFVATVSKGGIFAFLLRFFGQIDSRAYPALFLIFALIAVGSMLGGNLLALLQTNVKRILAYSSIAHLGYLLVAFLAGGALGYIAASYYLVAYIVTILTAFGIVTLLSGSRQEAELIEDYQGLFWRRPWLAAVFTASLLSLAGIPLTAGFIGKFYIVSAGVGSALWPLVLVLVAGSAISLYYYLRIVVAMSQPAQTVNVASASYLSLSGGVVLAVLMLLLVWLGVYPSSLINLIQATVTLMG